MMITQLNIHSNSWTRIYEIDMTGSHPDQDDKEYFATQVDIITSQQYTQGYYLRAITHFEYNWVLVFTPQRNGNNKF